MRIFVVSRRGSDCGDFLQKLSKKYGIEIICFQKYFKNHFNKSRKELIQQKGYDYVEWQQSLLFLSLQQKDNILLYCEDMIMLNEYIMFSKLFKGFLLNIFYEQDIIQCYLNYVKDNYLPFQEYQETDFDVQHWRRQTHNFKICNHEQYENFLNGVE